MKENLPTAKATAQSYPMTLVTAYFEMDKPAGRNSQDYHAWMKNFVPFIRWPLVIFCDETSLDRIKRLREHKPAVYIVTKFDEWYVYQYRDIFLTQWRTSSPPSMSCSSIDLSFLFMVFCEKPNFVRRAMEMNPFSSELFFWCDIGFARPGRSCGEKGLFRLSERIEWPNLQVCRTACSGKVTLVSYLHPLWHRLFNPYPKDFWVCGGFWGGPVEPLRQFCHTFHQFLHQRVQRMRPILSDEIILRDVYAARPDLARLVPIEHIRWLRWLNFRRLPKCWWWYFLNGTRFPWSYFRKEISLREVFGALFFGLRQKMKRSRIFAS